jgi:alpha-mannosidase
MDNLISYFNKHNTANMTLLYSTPGEYIDALHAQNLTWPTKYDDMFPYADNPQDYWSGYFASRQAAKKQVRDGQANLHASAQLLSRKVVQADADDAEIAAILSAKADMLDWMGVYQHHDAVSGTAKQHVADNYVEHLSKAMAHNNEVYNAELLKNMASTTGIVATELTQCTGAQNETVLECPVSDHRNQSEFIVVVHNPAAQRFTQLVRIQLPSSNYSAQVWSFEHHDFVDVHADIIT